ncbi:MAG: lytic murein transglycosylase, partial [Gammaproteobacteria bacterium]|nr:lytic murein transglycosylase [Gammaproteobacteria bacterium]
MKRVFFSAALAALALPGTASALSDDSQLRAALEAAGRGQAVPTHMASHPAYGWIEFASLRRDLAALPGNQAQSFLARYEGQAVAESFRAEWLRALHRRQDWAGIRAAWSPEVTNTTLRCIELDARQRLGAADAAGDAQVQEIWRSSGDSLPDQCDGPFAALDVRGALTPELRWERLELAAAEWNPGVMRAAASGLPAAERALADDYAAFVQSPHERALNWPKT